MNISSDLLQLPEEIRALRQFCVRIDKQPYVWDDKKGDLSPWGWQIETDKWLTFDFAIKLLESETKIYHGGVLWKIDGIGILLVGNGKDEAQLLGGDLDCCRDPETGLISEWAKKKIIDIKPFYTEISKSKCGIRFFVMGRLPNGSKYITGFGPQHELSSETVEHIFKVKPITREKLLKEEPAFNGIEFHESSSLYKNTEKYSAKHLVLTGWKLPEYCFPKEDRTIAIAKTLEDLVEDKPIKLKHQPIDNQSRQSQSQSTGPTPEWVEEMEETSKQNLLPRLDILKVIGRCVDLDEFTQSGCHLSGSHPLGSSTGRNLVINPELNIYSYMHYPHRPGGDPWVWLAHECGAAPWDVPGKGLLRNNPAIKNAAIAYAIAQGLVKAEQIIKDPAIRKVTLDDNIGIFGLTIDGTIVQVVEDKKLGKNLAWISDCAVMLHTETREDDITEICFYGRGAKDGFEKFWTVPVADMADLAEFRRCLLNALGASNRIGKLTFEIVVSMSRNLIKKQRVTIPKWRNNIVLVPGLDLASDIEYRMNQHTPAKVYDGDLSVALNVLKKLITLRKYTSLLVAVVLGSPVYARWFTGDRFGLALWGRSGSQKTTIAKLACTIYGSGFYEDHALIKHGKHGATSVGALETLYNAGILPRIIDDVKATDPKDTQLYTGEIHAVIEGGEKLRGKKDGGLRKTKAYLTTPIVTGEIRPAEASTSARVLNLNWVKVDDSQSLADIQEDMHLLPVIGYYWLRFLSQTNIDVRAGFESARTKKYNEFIQQGYTNPGRLATIYCLIRAVWALACESPLGGVFRELTPQFLSVLNEAVAEQGELVNEETEVAKFLNTLSELVNTRPNLFLLDGQLSIADKILGKITSKGFFVFPNETLALMKQLGAFNQVPNIDSMTTALDEEKMLVPAKEKDHRLYQVKINGKRHRGWLLVPYWENLLGTRLGTQNQSEETQVPEEPAGPAKNEREKNLEKKGENIIDNNDRFDNLKNDKTPGTPGTSGINKDNRLIDIDYIDIDSTQSGTQPVPNRNIAIDQAVIDLFKKKNYRIDNSRQGLLLDDLRELAGLNNNEIIKYLVPKGWELKELEHSGKNVLWVPMEVT